MWNFCKATAHAPVLAIGTAALLVSACGAEEEADPDRISVGLLAPFTGEFAAQGVNVERVMLVLEDTVNEAGGVADKPIRITAQDTHSEVTKGVDSAGRLAEDSSTLAFVGPDHDELIVAIHDTVFEPEWAHLLPGTTAAKLATPSEAHRFRIGALAEQLGCALAERMYNVGYRNIVVLYSQDRTSEAFGESVETTLQLWDLVGRADVTRIPVGPAPATMKQALSELGTIDPDGIILATSAEVGAQVVHQWMLSPQSGQADWFLAPNLLNRSFLANILPGGLEGAIGVAPAVAFEADAEGLAERVEQRFGDRPFIGSYYYYDAAVLAVLAIEAAAQKAGGVPTRAEVAEQVRRVARPPGERVRWDEIPEALEAIRSGNDVNYIGITGNLLLNSSGDTDHQAMSYRQERVENGETAFEAYLECVPTM